jgi:hypothetical protein
MSLNVPSTIWHQAVQGAIGEAGEVLGKMADGDLRARIRSDFKGDLIAIKTATNDMGD